MLLTKQVVTVFFILQAKTPPTPAEAMAAAAPQQIQVLMDEVTKQVCSGSPVGTQKSGLLSRSFLV